MLTSIIIVYKDLASYVYDRPTVQGLSTVASWLLMTIKSPLKNEMFDILKIHTYLLFLEWWEGCVRGVKLNIFAILVRGQTTGT